MAIIDINCPHCGLSRSVPEEKLPAQKFRVTCPSCKKSFPLEHTIAKEEFTDTCSKGTGIKRAVLAEIGLFLAIMAFAVILYARFFSFYLQTSVSLWVLLTPLLAIFLSIISLFSKNSSKIFPIFTIAVCLSGYFYISAPVLRVTLNQKFNLNLSDKYEVTPLHLAARTGNLEKIKVLIEKGVDVDIRDKKDRTPLLYAINGKRLEAIRLLLKDGADPNTLCSDTRVLTSAVRSLGKIGAELLLAAGADINATNFNDDKLYPDWRVNNATKNSKKSFGRTALFYALPSPETTAFLLEKGADPNAATASGVRPLHIVKNAESARLLLSFGADIEATLPSGDTPLHLVANADTAKVLIAQGARLEVKNQKHQTPLLRSRNVEVIQALLEAGADTQATDNRGRTALHLAEIPEQCEVLIRGGLAVNAQAGEEEHGATPLYKAIERNNLKMVKILVAHGAEINVGYLGGGTALHMASGRGSVKITKFLLQNGADPNARTKYKDTPLHLAARHGHLGTAKLLIEYGAKRIVFDRHDQTPLEITKSAKNPQVNPQLVELLAYTKEEYEAVRYEGRVFNYN